MRQGAMDNRADLRVRLDQAIHRFCRYLIRKRPGALRQDEDDIVQDVWMKVCEDPAEERAALAELETHDRLALSVQRHLRNVIRRLERYRKKLYPPGRPDKRADLLTRPDRFADPVAIEARAARIIDALPSAERTVYDRTRPDRTRREVARDLNITDRTLRNRWNRLEALVTRAIELE
jgi:hypothetical protein